MYIIVDFAHNTYGNITCKINDYFLNINMLVDIICIFNTLYFSNTSNMSNKWYLLPVKFKKCIYILLLHNSLYVKR